MRSGSPPSSSRRNRFRQAPTTTATRWCTPISPFNFGAFNDVARPFVRRYGQRVIDQDVAILAAQMDNIRRHGADFRDTPADVIHRCVGSLRTAVARGEGRGVHWTARVEITDRSLLDVGDGVMFGHRAACYAHSCSAAATSSCCTCGASSSGAVS